MSYPSRKYRWMRATERAFKRLDILASQIATGRNFSISEIIQLGHDFVSLGSRGLALHQGGGEHYRRRVETRTVEIEMALGLLRDFVTSRRFNIDNFPKFSSPWTRSREDVAEGTDAIDRLDDLRRDFGLVDEEVEA